MKRWFFLLFWAILPFTTSFAQDQPVQYTWKANHLEDDTFELIFKAKIAPGWYTYSMYLESYDGPIPTSVNFEGGNATATEKATEKTSKSSNKISGFDKMFDMDIIKYKKDLTIRQVFKVKSINDKVTGYLEYMTCDNSQCRPPTAVEFSFDPSELVPAATTPSTSAPTETTPDKTPNETNTSNPAHLPDETSNPDGTPDPEEERTTVEVPDTTPNVVETSKPEPAASSPLTAMVNGDRFDPSRPQLIATAKAPIGKCDGETGAAINNNVDLEGRPWWQIFLFGFGGGLVALLTPCVLPMVPMTVSLFSKQGGKTDRKEGIKNGLIFGASIVVIYVSLGLLITMATGGDANALNQLSTNWIMNLIFFALFTIFAFSFFGYFEITLPSSWVNKADQASSKGGLIGTFFGAFSIALVSFSCTGPIIGSLLVTASSNGGLTDPIVGMLGFSLALALPFSLFAIFPSMLQSLPKSGGWMTNMKVVLGFLELALGLKFLSTADLTEGWGILPYEAFVGAWLIIMFLMAAYLLGFIRFPHDPKNAKIGNVRKALGALALVVTASLATGFTINEETDAFRTPFWLSGLAPSACYSYIRPCAQPKQESTQYTFSNHCPPGMKDCFDDYDEALRYANDVNKPLLVDFTGYGCVNCRRMEENVWIIPEIKDIINNDYVLVSLYVDDRRPLPQKLTSSDGKTLRKVGDKWSTFQRINFEKISQPYYVLVTPDEKVLNTPRVYTPDVATYQGFLECGLQVFKDYQAQKMK